MNDYNILPISISNDYDKTKSVLESLSNYNQIKNDYGDEMLELFIKSITTMLTDDKYSGKKYGVYSKVFGEEKMATKNIIELANNCILDFLKGGTQTEIIYPTAYMCGCIFNATDYGKVKDKISDFKNSNNYSNNNSNNYSNSGNNDDTQPTEPLPNTTYDTLSHEEYWSNNVPSLI